MNALEIFDYESAPKGATPTDCPACGEPGMSPHMTPVSSEGDRYGFRIRTRSCLVCGAGWLAERMTKAAYADFYASGAYRRLVSWYHGREINDETIRPEQREYARRLVWVLAPWLTAPRVGDDFGNLRPLGAELLDVGGATGEVGALIGAVLSGSANVTLLDPAPADEVALGVYSTLQYPAEDAPLEAGYWEIILLCQTIDHLLDPAAVLAKLRKALTPGGLFFVDAVDFDIKREWKIDHPHNFTERALLRLLDRTGWTVATVTRWNGHVGAVCTG